MATIDVLLPVRNGMPYLREAIDSIRNQTFSDWRLLVLDHGSADGSLQLARRYSQTDKRIEVFSHPEADGVSALRNIGLAKCDCRYLMLQDADDVSAANRMEILIRAFDAAPNLLVVGSEAIVTDSAGRRTGYLRMPTNSKAVTAAAFFYNPIAHPTVAIDFHAAARLGFAYGADILNVVPRPESLAVKTLAEDYMLFGQLALLGPCANVAMPLIRYRRHAESVGILDPAGQIELALRVSRFLAKSFCLMNGLQAFDPGPFCSHADYVFDFGLRGYSSEFSHMAGILRHGLGVSAELERELAFRRVLATRKSNEMALHYLQFRLRNRALPSERRTVRNWLLRDIRRGKYVYRAAENLAGHARAAI